MPAGDRVTLSEISELPLLGAGFTSRVAAFPLNPVGLAEFVLLILINWVILLPT